MNQLKNKIIKTKLIKWDELKWLQPDNFKDTSPELLSKLKKSMLNNGFASPFNVWEDKGKLWILDGSHRERVIKEKQ